MNNKLSFNVTPNTDLTPWLIESNAGTAPDPEKIVCDFTNMPMNATFEITFTMTSQNWTFYGNGVEYCGAKSNCQYQLTSSVSKDGQSVTVTISPCSPSYTLDNTQIMQNLDKPICLPRVTEVSTDPVGFRLVASQNGDNLYLSQDPEVVIRRPPDGNP